MIPFTINPASTSSLPEIDVGRSQFPFQFGKPQVLFDDEDETSDMENITDDEYVDSKGIHIVLFVMI